jgi:uncharacterized RDD family membrane protein YckC
MHATNTARRPAMAEENQQRDGGAGRTFGRLVGSVVSPIIDNIDLDEVIDQVDVDELVSRIDIDEVVGRIDINEVVDRVDIARLIARVDLDQVLSRVDLDRVLGRIDPDALLDRVDPDSLLDRVDPDRLLDRVDPDALLDRVDPNRLLDRVDPDRLLDRVDPDRLMDRVDANRLLERVDVNQLVARTELGEIIARSTTGVFTQLLDVARTQIIITDQVAQGVPARVLRGARRELPPMPGGVPEQLDPAKLSPTERAVKVQGRFAGSVSRFLAFLIDQFAIGVVFAVGALLVQAAVRVVFRSSFNVDSAGAPVVIAFMLWSFLYTAGSLAATGSTIGKAILGLMVVRSDGTKLNARRAALRTLMFPLSFVVFGLGFLMGLVRRDRRELHDLIADTGVVYEWDADTAQLRANDAAPESGQIAGTEAVDAA